MQAGHGLRLWVPVAVAAALVLLAPFFATGYVRYVATLWMIYAIAAVGLQIPIGLAAIYSFGHGAFMLIGAYAMADALAAYDKSLQPAGFTMFGCLAAKMFVDVLKRVGPEPTRAALIAELDKTRNFESGFSGPISFSPTVHQGLTAMYPIAVQNGQFKVIGAPVPLSQ